MGHPKSYGLVLTIIFMILSFILGCWFGILHPVPKYSTTKHHPALCIECHFIDYGIHIPVGLQTESPEENNSKEKKFKL